MAAVTTIRVGSRIVAEIGSERIEQTVTGIEITEESGDKYGDPAPSAQVGEQHFMVTTDGGSAPFVGRFVYSYQLRYVDGTWVGDAV